MWRRQYGLTRRDMRGGSGVDVEEEHYDEVLGSSEFFIYLPPNKETKKYPQLKHAMEALGCDVEFPAFSSLLPGDNYKAIKITKQGQILPDSSLRRSHRWAHKQNLLHSFFKPLNKPPEPEPSLGV